MEDMSDIKQHSEIMLALGRLEGSINGVNQRLDALNGKVASHERRLNEGDIATAKSSGIQTVLFWFGSIVSSVVVALIIGAIAKHFNIPIL